MLIIDTITDTDRIYIESEYFSMGTITENVETSEIEARKKELRKEKLKRMHITDKVFSETMDRLSVEERYKMLYYYIINDVYKKADLK